VREALGRMLFKSDMMTARVGTLSGGERARLALAKLLLVPANLLLLDEPTNHLDIPSKEALEAALSGYEGAILVASHDRYFLERLRTSKLIVMEGAGEPPVVRLGTYDDWRELQARAEAARLEADAAAQVRQAAQVAEQQALDDEIARMEAKREALARRLADPAAFKEDGAWGELLEEYQAVDARLSGLLARRQGASARAVALAGARE
jgi:ATP-binding cassette subfamily F protein 3